MADLQEKIEAIKETMASQKARDAALAKQVKKGKKKEKDAPRRRRGAAAGVGQAGGRRGGDGRAGAPSSRWRSGRRRSSPRWRTSSRPRKAALKEQEDKVASFTNEVVVPPDVVAYAQLKLKSGKCCDAMLAAQRPSCSCSTARS